MPKPAPSSRRRVSAVFLTMAWATGWAWTSTRPRGSARNRPMSLEPGMVITVEPGDLPARLGRHPDRGRCAGDPRWLRGSLATSPSRSTRCESIETIDLRRTSLARISPDAETRREPRAGEEWSRRLQDCGVNEWRRTPSGPTEPLDVRRIHHLVRLMKRYDLTAIDFSRRPVQIRLRRADPSRPCRPRPRSRMRTGGTSPGPCTARAAAAPRAPSPAPPPAPPAAKTVVIESPMVGTYYASSAPDAPPFVSVGSVGPSRHDRLHHRGDEGLHRHPRGRLGNDRRGPGQERPGGRVRPAPVPRDSGLTRSTRPVADRSEVDVRRCFNGSWWPTAARSRCGSSAPARSWTSRSSPSTRRPTATRPTWRMADRAICIGKGRQRRQLPEHRRGSSPPPRWPTSRRSIPATAS